MPLTREFRATLQARAGSDASYRTAMRGEAVNVLRAGEPGLGKAILRDYGNATIHCLCKTSTNL